MRNLLALIGLAVVVFFGLGWYLGWYQWNSTPTSGGGRHIEIDINKNKIQQDTNKVKQTVHDLFDGKGNPQPVSPPPQPPGGLPTFKVSSDETSITFPGTGQVVLPTPR